MLLTSFSHAIEASIQITGSKSESNRLLILQQLYPNLEIKNLSNSDDTQLLEKALKSTEEVVNIGHAGTAMRFLTAYFAASPGREVILTGSGRMKDRPIQILAEALKSLGADIEYVEKEGFPPLRIKGKELTEASLEIDGNVSSQYISALLLIGGRLKNGLQLRFKGKVTSVPYIKMTLSLLSELGIENNWEGDTITVKPTSTVPIKTVTVESDWSSASYYFSYAALAKGSEITLSSYKRSSLQGDAVLVDIYKKLGIQTTFVKDQIHLKQTAIDTDFILKLDLKSAPDIAQTIVVTCFGMGISCELTGLHTLKIKETDRLVALKIEIEKLGGTVHITDDSLRLEKSTTFIENIAIDTYQDHRMAMAFAPMATKVDIRINEADVVSKSYPTFWEDYAKVSTNTKNISI
ncbi:MAG: 3-phosphoshikimate 1-carboxyvinyltransferase [Flavobacteriaceae bacterium]|nr:MAG: 3-phosphoshikimate 1-carboxyvinyltransferase [Flavobacteriaceae bacterium]